MTLSKDAFEKTLDAVYNGHFPGYEALEAHDQAQRDALAEREVEAHNYKELYEMALTGLKGAVSSEELVQANARISELEQAVSDAWDAIDSQPFQFAKVYTLLEKAHDSLARKETL